MATRVLASQGDPCHMQNPIMPFNRQTWEHLLQYINEASGLISTRIAKEKSFYTRRIQLKIDLHHPDFACLTATLSRQFMLCFSLIPARSSFPSIMRALLMNITALPGTFPEQKALSA